MKTVLTIAALLLLGGCASDAQYKAYADAHAADAQARASVLKTIAKTSSEGAVAAGFATLIGGGQGAGGGLRAPESAGDAIFKWVAALAGPTVQAYGIFANTQLGMRQSDNGASVARSTNDTFLGTSKLIQAPGAITNTDRHDVYTPAPVVVNPPVIVTPPAPVVVNPPVVITPVITGGK